MLLRFSPIVGLVHRALINPIKLNVIKFAQQVLKITAEIIAERLNIGNLAVGI